MRAPGWPPKGGNLGLVSGENFGLELDMRLRYLPEGRLPMLASLHTEADRQEHALRMKGRPQMNDDHPISVLIVDDEPSVRDTLAEFLVDFGYRVLTAGNGESALEMLKTSSFNIAIVDLCLPGISGETFIFQAHASNPGLKFMIHTGSAGYRLSEQLAHIGIRSHHVFLKPLMNLNVFLETLKGLLPGAEDN